MKKIVTQCLGVEDMEKVVGVSGFQLAIFKQGLKTKKLCHLSSHEGSRRKTKQVYGGKRNSRV